MDTQEIKAVEYIEKEKHLLIETSDYIFDNPELGNQEFEASKRLTKILEDSNFKVEFNISNLPTAFKATYINGTGGPKIGLLCEYDALENLGHACGHHMQGPAIVGAATAVVNTLKDYPFELYVFGTPAEETESGKLVMVKDGVFDDLDVALMMHGGDRTTVDSKSLALNLVNFEFKGKSSHAAVAPEQGISALDAVIMTFNGIEYLREHVRSDVKMHGVILEGGKTANIVPDWAVAQFYIRAADREYLNEVVERVYNVARGAAQMIGAEVNIKEIKAYDNKINVETLNKVLLKNAEMLGAKEITPPREKTGSTDFSSVTYRVPGACIRVCFTPFGASSHSQQWLDSAKSEDGHNAVIIGAKTLAVTCIQLIKDKNLMADIKEEFNKVKRR